MATSLDLVYDVLARRCKCPAGLQIESTGHRLRQLRLEVRRVNPTCPPTKIIHLESLRAALLVDLLRGNHDISESYDALLEST